MSEWVFSEEKQEFILLETYYFLFLINLLLLILIYLVILILLPNFVVKTLEMCKYIYIFIFRVLLLLLLEAFIIYLLYYFRDYPVDTHSQLRVHVTFMTLYWLLVWVKRMSCEHMVDISISIII